MYIVWPSVLSFSTQSIHQQSSKKKNTFIEEKVKFGLLLILG